MWSKKQFTISSSRKIELHLHSTVVSPDFQPLQGRDKLKVTSTHTHLAVSVEGGQSTIRLLLAPSERTIFKNGSYFSKMCYKLAVLIKLSAHQTCEIHPWFYPGYRQRMWCKFTDTALSLEGHQPYMCGFKLLFTNVKKTEPSQTVIPRAASFPEQRKICQQKVTCIIMEIACTSNRFHVALLRCL